MKNIKKFQIGGTNDEFFQPDALKVFFFTFFVSFLFLFSLLFSSSLLLKRKAKFPLPQWYWDGIPGQKNYRIVAGANHGLEIDGDKESAVCLCC